MVDGIWLVDASRAAWNWSSGHKAVVDSMRHELREAAVVLEEPADESATKLRASSMDPNVWAGSACISKA